MTLPIRDYFESVGLRTGALSDDECIELGQMAVTRFGKTTVPVLALRSMTNEIIDRRRRLEPPSDLVVVTKPKVMFLGCCRGKRFAGPSGYRRRHVCQGRKGEPYETNDVETVAPWMSGAVHPACKAAWAEGAQPCERCVPLLHPATCECPVCDDWWARTDDEDDVRGPSLD